ncbi:ACC deaminase [Fusarium mundagurra]|uniref:ACC deaminase n=1 Tax=Fusarium mundagurra TaxID=1567541 RepID=A0A8H5YI00_9HYPO|nr:ACC deaminase [Fusarium mundagurra]
MIVLPELFASFERTPLLFPHPSSLHPLPNLTRQINSTTSTKAQISAKCEDCSSGLSLGGNKIRKLEYVIPLAIAQGCDTLISTGGTQSNHMRQVAAVDSHLGLKTILVPQVHGNTGSGAFFQAGKVQVNGILGAEVAAPNAALEDVAADVEKQGGRPYVIASGASAHLHGRLGFARWAFEVVEQETAHGIFFDTIVVPEASGGTIAGMIAGFKLARGQSQSIIGINTYNKPPGVLKATILEIARRTADLIGLGADAVQPDDVILDTRFNTGTHTSWDGNTARGVELISRLEGIVTDPIYSGRSVGAILHKVENRELDGSRYVLNLFDRDSKELDILLKACERDGFFYLDLQDSCSAKLWRDLDRVSEIAKRWFSQPVEDKLKPPTVSLAHGLKATGNQSGAVKSLKDGFEALKIGRSELFGRWALPSVVEENLQLFDQFNASCHFILKLLLDRLSDGLNLRGASRLDTYHRDDARSKSILYFLHYPPGTQNLDEVGQNMHTDIGTLTLLFAPQWALQVVSPVPGAWEYVQPREGHAIINVADTLRFLSNKRFRSALHRVLPMGGVQKEDRYAVSYFLRAADDTEFKDSNDEDSNAKSWYLTKYHNYELPHEVQGEQTVLSGGMAQELQATF